MLLPFRDKQNKELFKAEKSKISNYLNIGTYVKLIEEFDGLVDMVIMGDKVSKISSTIVELSDNKVILIREGSIPFKEIEETFYRR